MKKKTIIFTGGGSGGHVIPSLTLMTHLEDFDIEYIGGTEGIEKELVTSKVKKYHPILTGKLRRYFSFQNFIDFFKVLIGLIQSFFILICKRSDTLVFSTGGFVSVPVVVAAWLTNKKIFIHEQTARVGLANKISSKFASKVFISFERSRDFFPKEKVLLSGYPLKKDCLKKEGKDIFLAGMNLKTSEKPILFITGGGNGSKLLNELVKKEMDFFSKKYLIIHQVGGHFIEEYLKYKSDDYWPYAFIKDEMIDLMKLSSIIISRSGAGTVCELMALNKPSIFIPLKIAQKNEQFYNAKEAEKNIGSLVLEENELEKMALSEAIELFLNNKKIVFKNYIAKDGSKLIIESIRKHFMP